MKRPILLLVPLALAGLDSAAPAQGCPGATLTLAVTPDACLQPGDTVSIQTCGLGPHLDFLAVSLGLGETALGPIGSTPPVRLCLAQPLYFDLGAPDPATGCSSLLVPIPAGAVLAGNVEIYLQAIRATFYQLQVVPPFVVLVLSTSNVEKVCL